MSYSRILATSFLALVFTACGHSSSTPETAPAPAPTPAPAAPDTTAASAPSAGVAGNAAGDTLVRTEVIVNVVNNRLPPSVVTVYARGASIGRIILGDVPNGQTRAFSFKTAELNGDYYLVAQRPGGGELSSPKFNLTPTLRFVQWSLDVNLIVQYQTPR